MIVNKSMFPLQTSFGVISKMQDKFAQLQVQLATGEKAQKLSEMGSDLPLSLSVRSRLSKIDGYSNNIDTVNLRLSFLDKTLTRFDKIEGEARNAAVPGQYGTGGINMATLPSLSHARFDEIVTMLNEDVAGRYLFGGKITDKAPLPTTDVLLNGESGRYGFTRAAELRQQADGVNDPLITDPLDPDFGHTAGRLVLGGATDTVSLAEDGTAQHPFGFKLSTLSTTANPASVVLTPQDATVPKTLSVQFAAQPSNGDTVSLGFTLPDGTETQIKLTATTESPAPAGSFTIGADTTETANNFRAALNGSLQTKAKTDLKAASTFAASNDFFHESGVAQRPDPVTGRPTSLVADNTTVVQWYSGSVTPPTENVRNSVSSAIDDAARVNYGMEATESGFLRMVRSQAALAITSYKSEETVRGDFADERTAAMNLPEGAARDAALAQYEKNVQDAYRLQTGLFDGMASRQQSELSEAHNSEKGSIEIITMDLGIARQSLQSATERHTAYQSQLLDLLTDVETIDKETVAMEILALQTRLTASYQTTSMVSQLSLVNFLR